MGIWMRDPNRLIVTVLVANNIANTAASFFFTRWVDKRFVGSEWRILVAVGTFTLTLILFSEILPKLFAKRFSVRWAPYAMRGMRWVMLALRPLVATVNFVTSSIVRGSAASSSIGEEELSHTIQIAANEGGIDRETGEVLSNLIDFPDRLARDIMTPRSRVQAISISWTLTEVMKFIANDGHSRYPVIRNSFDEIVGVLLVKDLLAHVQKGNPGLWTRVVRRPYFVSEMAPLGKILRDMRRWGTHLALVRDELGIVTGLLTLEDLIEEIVGEIRDEHDDPVEGPETMAMGGPTVISGDMPIIDFNEKYDASLPMELSYSTVNGYLLSKTGGEIPPVGTLIFADDISFRIHSISDTGVVTLQIIARDESDSSN